MSRAATFKQADVTRALKGAEAAGVRAAVMIRPDGTMMIVPSTDRIAVEGRSDLDTRLDEFGAL